MAASMRSVLGAFQRAPNFVSKRQLRPFIYTYSRSLLYRKQSTQVDNDDTQSHETDNSKITQDSRVDTTVAEWLEERFVGSGKDFMNYKGHSGVMRQSIQLPAKLLKAVKIVLEKYPVDESKVKELSAHLQNRRPPASDDVVKLKAAMYEKELLEKDPNMFNDLGEAERQAKEAKLKKKVIKHLRKQLYHWKPMHYEAYTSIVYLLARLSIDYSVSMQCLTEISKREPNFKPTSIYHHGSKLGASIWASNKLWSTIGEHYCVESSSDMNAVARLLLQGGNEQERVLSVNGVYFRHHLPSSGNKFSMVVSPYMLLEQSSQAERLQLLLNLWQMTESYLVLIELGTVAGFSLIHEARDYLLNLGAYLPDDEQFKDTVKEQAHIFAPCPHEHACPRVSQQAQPCIHQCYHRDVNYGTGKQKSGEKTWKYVKYSYVILKKGPRPESTAWPRVLQSSKSKRHCHSFLCLPSGQLQHVVVTKGKFDKHAYGCVRTVSQGDLLPISLSTAPPTPTDQDENTPSAPPSLDSQELPWGDAENSSHTEDSSFGSEKDSRN